MTSIVLLQGIEITPFVDPWSTTTMRESNFSLGGRSVMKSMVTWENGRPVVVPLIGINPGEVGCVLTFICWHRAHPAT